VLKVCVLFSMCCLSDYLLRLLFFDIFAVSIYGFELCSCGVVLSADVVIQGLDFEFTTFGSPV